MKTIVLYNQVMVSDPCYEVGTWCQHKLTNVLPGEYQTMVMKFDNYSHSWGPRNSFIIAVHKDHNTEDKLNWRKVVADIGVDSGQAGIFSMETYRQDEVFLTGISEHTKKYGTHKDDGGEEWYGHMCDLTDNTNRWGVYPNGVVSSSGLGDGSYELRVAKHKGKVVGILLDFFMEKLTNQVIELLRTSEMLGDVCGVCGEDNVDSESCNCKN